MADPLFFVDHGTIHCRATSRHVSIEEACDMLNIEAGATERIAWGIVATIGPQLRAAGDECVRLTDVLRTARVEAAEAEQEIKRLRSALVKAANFAESSIEMMREDMGEDEDELAEYAEWLADWRSLAGGAVP